MKRLFSFLLLLFVVVASFAISVVLLMCAVRFLLKVYDFFFFLKFCVG